MISRGTIAGIGDKSQNLNLITPQFDAQINNFIIGENCILDGLELVDTAILNKGSCIAQGYVGQLNTSTYIDTTEFIYGVFKINFDTNIVDEFYIETSRTEKNIKNDILHFPGTYYLLLYKNGKLQLPHKYPAKAVYANNTDHINEGGTLGKNVTAPTQPLNTNNQTPATTEFVQNQIKKEIGYDIKEVKIYYNISQGTEIGKIVLEKKSKYVIGEVIITKSPLGKVASPLFKFDNVPENFIPQKNIYFAISYATGTPNQNNHISIFSINTNGKIVHQQTVNSGINGTIYAPCVFGYKIN